MTLESEIQNLSPEERLLNARGAVDSFHEELRSKSGYNPEEAPVFARRLLAVELEAVSAEKETAPQGSASYDSFSLEAMDIKTLLFETSCGDFRDTIQFLGYRARLMRTQPIPSAQSSMVANKMDLLARLLPREVQGVNGKTVGGTKEF